MGDTKPIYSSSSSCSTIKSRGSNLSSGYPSIGASLQSGNLSGTWPSPHALRPTNCDNPMEGIVETCWKLGCYTSGRLTSPVKQILRVRIPPCACSNPLVSGRPLNRAQIRVLLVLDLSG
ncbi:hypothetical protein PIB30_080622 [Stylosanthes scabra]|uniref:Uncharacterized protein n=1 Tax=Stylosanthes scabra TaxID=79078 RepID=A0ABU6SSS5_9FABA|nr:hypothetical protein [Stylosanthes scabra]